MTNDVNLIASRYGKDRGITQAVKAGMQNKNASVNYNGSVWTVLDPAGVDLATKVKIHCWDKTLHRFRMLISSVFKTSYKITFNGSVDRLTAAQKNYQETIKTAKLSENTTSFQPPNAANANAPPPTPPVIINPNSAKTVPATPICDPEKAPPHVETTSFPFPPKKVPTKETITLPLANQSPAMTAERVNEVQIHLDDHHIPLKCRDISRRIENPNMMIGDSVTAYLNELETLFESGVNSEYYIVKKKLFDSVDFISFEELQRGLSSCCAKLNELLGGNQYAIGYLPGASQQWMAELALPLMKQLPNGHFQAESDHSLEELGAFSKQSDLPTGIHHFVVFDDASFTGSQNMTICRALDEKIKKLNLNEECHLYFVVPFMSHLAKALTVIKRDKLNIHLITTDRPIKKLTDPGLFTDSEVELLCKMDTRGGAHGPHIYFEENQPKYLSFMQWGTPKDHAVPSSLKYSGKKMVDDEHISVKYRFMTNFKPYGANPTIDQSFFS